MLSKVIIEIIYLYSQIWPPLADNFGDLGNRLYSKEKSPASSLLPLHGPGMKDQLAFVYFSSDRSTLHGLYYIRFAYIFGHRDGSTVRNSRYCTLSSMNSVKA